MDNPVAEWMKLMVELAINGWLAIFILWIGAFLWEYKEEAGKVLFVCLFLIGLVVSSLYLYSIF